MLPPVCKAFPLLVGDRSRVLAGKPVLAAKMYQHQRSLWRASTSSLGDQKSWVKRAIYGYSADSGFSGAIQNYSNYLISHSLLGPWMQPFLKEAGWQPQACLTQMFVSHPPASVATTAAARSARERSGCNAVGQEWAALAELGGSQLPPCQMPYSSFSCWPLQHEAAVTEMLRGGVKELGGEGRVVCGCPE